MEKKLIIQKDEEILATHLKTNEERAKVIAKFLESDRFSNLQFVQYFKGFELLRRWMTKHYSQVADFANLDFEATDIEILANENKEKEDETVIGATDVVEGDGTAVGGVTNEASMDVGHVKEVVSAP